ncbi:cation:proton antiporter [Phycisphaerales bacterium AB-hyl4]|uniref:Cation:proton antiporter n=1 Tax=Natronomicrosphaera hydrolytica TaxID=3242702 RepID=A0ABV4UAP6_9BACT
MTAVLYILVAAAAGLALAKWLRLPSVPMLVLAGLTLRMTGLVPDEALLRDAMLLGLAFLVFVAGTELNPDRLGDQRRAALVVGLAQFIVLAVVGIAVARMLGFAWETAAYIGLALTASSTLVVVTLLRQRQQFFEPFGRLVLGVLLLQDILVIVAIAALSGVDGGPEVVGLRLGGMAALLLLAWVCVRWVTPWLMLKLNLDEESLLLVLLAMLFTFVGLSQWMGLPMVTGAFLAGVSLSGFPSNGIVRGQVNSLADFFLAVFFVALGGALMWLGPAELVLAMALVVLVLVVTPPLVAWVGRRVGLSSRVSIESGLLLAQCSEFSLVVVLLGVEQGHVSEDVFAIVALVTVVTMILTPFVATDANTWRVMRLRLPHGWVGGERRETRPSDHVLMLGCGTNGQKLADALVQRGHRVVVVDDDPGMIARLRQRGVEAVRGDGADYIILRDVGARAAKVVVSTMRRTSDNERMLRFLWDANVPVVLRTFGPDAAERFAVYGAIPIIESELGADATLAWFEETFLQTSPATADAQA